MMCHGTNQPHRFPSGELVLWTWMYNRRLRRLSTCSVVSSTSPEISPFVASVTSRSEIDGPRTPSTGLSCTRATVAGPPISMNEPLTESCCPSSLAEPDPDPVTRSRVANSIGIIVSRRRNTSCACTVGENAKQQNTTAITQYLTLPFKITPTSKFSLCSPEGSYGRAKSPTRKQVSLFPVGGDNHGSSRLLFPK